MSESYTRIRIPASELRPGDIVLDKRGERGHAAFDVEVGHASVFVWTAASDRENGWPERVSYHPAGVLDVDRRERAPQTTRMTLTLMEDGSVDVDRHDGNRWPRPGDTVTDRAGDRYTVATVDVDGRCRLVDAATGEPGFASRWELQPAD